MLRGALTAVVGAGVLLTAAAPAAPPVYPATFIGVDELKAMLDRGRAVTIIDVRTRSEFDEQHITNARSIPLRSLPQRTREISRTQPVVLY